MSHATVGRDTPGGVLKRLNNFAIKKTKTPAASGDTVIPAVIACISPELIQ
jgi:hypothetical protein